jgi:hypothetical protein
MNGFELNPIDVRVSRCTNDNADSYNGCLDGMRLFNRSRSANKLLALP